MALVNNGPVHFVVDAKASLLTVQAFASGLIAVVAHSPKFAARDFSGNIKFDAVSIGSSAVYIEARVGSLEIMDEVSTLDRREIERVMFDEVLEKSVHPKVEFKSTQINATKMSENVYRIRVGGDVTLHGITHGLGFETHVVVGEDTIRAQGSFSLMQSDFDLKIASVANGTLKLKDELRLGFFLVARRK